MNSERIEAYVQERLKTLHPGIHKRIGSELREAMALMWRIMESPDYIRSDSPAWCNSCAWSGTVAECGWSVDSGLVCPECERCEIDAQKTYAIDENTRRSIAYMTQKWWEQNGKGPTYNPVNEWLEKTSRTDPAP